MSGAKRNTNVKSNKQPTEGKYHKESISIGPEYQASIPDVAENRPDSYCDVPSDREVKVWDPDLCPSSPDIDAYISEAKKQSYPEDAALALLHYHKYNAQQALDDLPNYEPILNTYTRSDVKRFLKCVDSRPRKNFVKVKRDFPGYRMGEIQALYYSIAAPFKAIARRDRKYGRQMKNCFQKAVNLNFTGAHSITGLHQGESDLNEVEADTQFESYFHRVLPPEQAAKICTSVIRGRLSASTNNGNGHSSKNSNSTSRTIVANGAFIPIRRPRGAKAFGDKFEKLRAPKLSQKTKKGDTRILQDFNLDEFNNYTSATKANVSEEQANAKKHLETLDVNLKSLTETIETANGDVFQGLHAFYPRKCFENEVTFRWTKAEIAILIMALDSCGRDFAAIAKIMATKTESMIRDFYNKYKSRFGLDAFINKENTEPKEEEEKEEEKEKAVVVMREENHIELSENGAENEVDQNEDPQSLEPPLIITTPHQRRVQPALNFPRNPIVKLAPPTSTSLKEEEAEKEANAELPAEKTVELEVKEEIAAAEVKKDDDAEAKAEVAKPRRAKTQKEPPARRVSTRSQSSASPADTAVKRRRSRLSDSETPTRRPKSLSSSIEPPPKPRGRPPGKTARKNQDSSTPMQSLKDSKGERKSRKVQKVREPPAVAPKRRSSMNSQESSEAPKKRARNSSTFPRPNRLRR
ncbi:hypothetical protein Aperf_G00000084123 [Anoplocephala perfoliata]